MPQESRPQQINNTDNKVSINQQILAKIQQISQKDPFEMTYQQVSFLQNAASKSSFWAHIVENRGIQIFTRLLWHHAELFKMRAFCAVANLSLMSTQKRMEFINNGVLERLIEATKQMQGNRKGFEFAIWAMNNICLDPAIQQQYIRQSIRYFCQLLVTNKIKNDELTQTLLGQIMYRKNSTQSDAIIRGTIIVQTNLIPCILELCHHYKKQIASNAIHLLMNISETHPQQLINLDIIGRTQAFLFDSDSSIRQDILRLFGAIGNQSAQQAFKLIGDERMVESLLIIFKNDQLKVAGQVAILFAFLIGQINCLNTARALFQNCKLLVFFAEFLLKCSIQDKGLMLQQGLRILERLLSCWKRIFLQDQISIKNFLFGFDFEFFLSSLASGPSIKIQQTSSQIISKYFS